MDDFGYLSYYYDQFVGADYCAIGQYIDHKIQKYCPIARDGVDLGCGSGTLTYILEEYGYDMIGVDRSQSMLMQAADKKPPHSNVLLLQQDLTRLQLHHPVDFMISTLDCLNYLEEENDVERFLKRCASFLKPNGLLILDYNTIYKYKHILDGQNFIYETEDTFCVWENEFDGQHMYYDLTYFVQTDNLYERCEDHQIQTYYSSETILNLIQAAGFDVLSLEDDYRGISVGEQTQRIVLTAQKRSN